jgi:hypothetical protein
MSYRLFLIFLVFIYSTPLWAQSHSSIRSGRPGQSIGPFVVGTGYLQLQSGVEMDWARNGSKTDTQIFDNVIRYGLNESFEISTLIDWQKDEYFGAGPVDTEGLSQFQLGFRYNIFDHSEGWLPVVGIQTRFRLKTVSSDYRGDHVAPVIILVTQHSLPNDLSFATNWTMANDGTSSIPTYGYTFNLGIPINDKWGTYAEVYGKFRDDYGSIYADTGFSYLVNNDFQLDLYGGWGNNRGVSEGFVSAGFSWRAQTRPHLMNE